MRSRWNCIRGKSTWCQGELLAPLVLSILLISFTTSVTASAQHHVTQDQPPAVPLITHNPYFSIWSMDDHLTDGNTRHWTGTEQPLIGLIQIDHHSYRFMGRKPGQIPPMHQTSLEVALTHTHYAFEAEGIALELEFFTPAFPDDIITLSRPVTYLTWYAHAIDSRSHLVSLYLDVDPLVAVNSGDQQVSWGRYRTKDLTVLTVGSRDQQPLNRSGDNLRIDWGYFHLAIPDSEHAESDESSVAEDEFLKNGRLSGVDEMEMPRSPNASAAHLAVAFPIGQVGTSKLSRHLLVSYTQGPAIEYLGRPLREYWQRENETIEQMLESADRAYLQLEVRGRQFDRELTADLTTAGGSPYAKLAVLAYRQTLAAHGLVADVDGTLMMFPKENFSNGCISTVDVIYPSAPLFLLLNPRLLEAQLIPILEYATLPRWKWPFAPHDLGRYPLANGQIYGGGENSEENQMPIEESGNLLILATALGQTEGDWHIAQRYWPLFTKWADYVMQKGLDPENQLSTDDFAGHLAHNANLSIKAIEALGAYAKMAHALGKQTIADDFAAKAKSIATRWEAMSVEGDHYKLAFNKPGTWSQKYNLVWDDLLDLKLFDPRIKRIELAFYQTKLNRYGLPLDGRETYTKVDWEIWTATMAESSEQFQAFVAPVATWLNETPTRVPLTDWYDTIDGRQVGFQARSVVGGVYIKALANQEIASKWRSKSIGGNVRKDE
jgi:hypothetical protein